MSDLSFVQMLKNAKNLKTLLVMAGQDTRPDSDYVQADLAMGVQSEMEHTNSLEIAKKIAKDHLDEMSDYYRKLKVMEGK